MPASHSSRFSGRTWAFRTMRINSASVPMRTAQLFLFFLPPLLLEPESPELESPELESPELESPELESPELESPELELEPELECLLELPLLEPVESPGSVVGTSSWLFLAFLFWASSRA